MKQLIVFVLRLLLQLVLFAITGRWVALGRDARPLPRSVRAGQSKQQAVQRSARTFSTERKAPRARPPRAPAPMPAFAEEGTYRDPEWAVREGGPVPALRVRAVRPVSRRPAPTSLRGALADPRVIRDALAFDAALGTSSEKRRRRR